MPFRYILKDKQYTYLPILFIFISLFVFNLFYLNESTALWDDDESAYMGFATEMYNGASWINPEYPKADIHRKTPLHFWLCTISMHIFGNNTFALRFISALAVLLNCLLLFLLGKSVFGHKIALNASIILSSTLLLPVLGKISLTDATLTLFTTVAAISLFACIQKPNFKWHVLLWSSVAAGIMTKGPIIIIVIGGIWLFLLLFYENKKAVLNVHPWIGGLLALIPFFAWAYSSYMQDYQIWENANLNIPFEEWWQEEELGKKKHLLPFLLDWYILRRVGGSVLGQTGLPGYHFLIIIASFFTWLAIFPNALKQLYIKIKEKNTSALFVLSWLLFGWIFWEFMSSKLLSYSLPAHPAIALMLAICLESKTYNTTKTYKILKYFSAFIFLVIAIITYPLYSTYISTIIPLNIILLIISSLFLAAFNFIALRKNFQFLYTNAFNGLIFLFLVVSLLLPLLEKSSVKSIPQITKEALVQAKNDSSAIVIISGLDIKQLEISMLIDLKSTFGYYEYRNFFGGTEAYKTNKNTVLIIGEVAYEKYNKWFTKYYPQIELKAIKYRPADDAFKEHKFWVIGNKN